MHTNSVISADELSALCAQPQMQEIMTLSAPTSGTPIRPAMVGSLILDGYGCIRFCSSALALLAGMTAVDLVGRSIKSLLPDMPVSATTPGYNVAFAAFSCAAGDLHKWMLIRSDGAKVPVDATITSLKTGTEYLFCLGLHCPSQPDVVLDEAHQIDTPASTIAENASASANRSPRHPSSAAQETLSRVMASTTRRIRADANQNFS